MRFETIPQKEAGSAKSWNQLRISIQLDLMRRMGANTELDTPDTQKEASQVASQWIDKYAARFAELTNDDLALQQQLMSEDIAVRDSAMSEVIHQLEDSEAE